jgi:hypothetical protein
LSSRSNASFVASLSSNQSNYMTGKVIGTTGGIGCLRSVG